MTEESVNINDFLNKALDKSKDAIDYTKNTKIGELGEKFILMMEKEKLREMEIKTKKYPIHVSHKHGDHHGFDILSIDKNEDPLLLEVKTTTQSKRAPIYITKNEIDKLKKYKQNYKIVRVYNFDTETEKGEYTYINAEDFLEMYNLKEKTFIVSKK